MKRIYLIAVAFLAFTACADSNNNNTGSDAEGRNESSVHPPEEAVPDTLEIKNDSVIGVDSTPDGNRNNRDTQP